MKAHNDFIVHIPNKYKDTLKTKNGVKLYLDSRFSGKTAANNIFEVVNTPVNYDGEIKPGGLLLVDPIVVHSQRYKKWGQEENPYLIDRKKNLYRINPSLIICYAPNNGDDFKGFNDNLICEKHKVVAKEKELKKIGSIYVPNMSVEKVEDTSVLKVIIGNQKLATEENIFEEDLIYYKPTGAVDIMIRDNQYVWLKNKYVLGKHLKQAI